jgi:hypothetical protein
MQRGERTTRYAVVEAYSRKMQMQLQHLLQLLQLRFDLHFEDADPTPTAAGDSLRPTNRLSSVALRNAAFTPYLASVFS